MIRHKGFMIRISWFLFGLGLFIIPPSLSGADSLESRFAGANQLYRDGKHDEAARLYEEIIAAEPNFEVYYNLGNAYFKSKRLGKAILNYERARRLSPRDRDVLENLAYVNQLIEYKIEDKRNWFLRKKSELVSYLTFHECWLFALGAYFVFVVGILISFIRREDIRFGKLRILSLVLVVFCSLPLFLKFAEKGMSRQGIVTEKQAEVRYGPSRSDRIAFRLVEGLAILIDDEKENWLRIRLRDSRSGWVPQSEVTPL